MCEVRPHVEIIYLNIYNPLLLFIIMPAVTREPYEEKLIENLESQDYRVAISGYVVNKQEGSFFIYDGTGQSLIYSLHPPPGDYVRVFGRTQPLEEGMAVEADIIQNLSDVNKELLKTMKTFLHNP